MKTTRLVAALLAALSLIGAPACGGGDVSAKADALSAGDVCLNHACCSLVTALDTQTANTTFPGKNGWKDEAGLRNDLLNVSIDLEKGTSQYADAAQTLMHDYWRDVMKLASCGRNTLAAAVAEPLLAGAEAASLCISGTAPDRTLFVCPLR